jgi:hypothetical protein
MTLRELIDKLHGIFDSQPELRANPVYVMGDAGQGGSQAEITNIYDGDLGVIIEIDTEDFGD